MTDAPRSNLSPIKSVRVDALVVLKISKHASSAHPQIVTGQLLGTSTSAMDGKEG